MGVTKQPDGSYLARIRDSAGKQKRQKFKTKTEANQWFQERQASLTKGDLSFGTQTISVEEEDLRGLKITALPAVPIEAEVALDGQVPDKPLDTHVRVARG